MTNKILSNKDSQPGGRDTFTSACAGSYRIVNPEGETIGSITKNDRIWIEFELRGVDCSFFGEGWMVSPSGKAFQYLRDAKTFAKTI